MSATAHQEIMSATAHHEAGHAVIGRALGLYVGEVTIEETRTAWGSCELRHFNDDPEQLRAYMLALLAAGFADAKYRGVRWDCFEYSADPTNGEGRDLATFSYQLMRYVRLTGYSARAAEALLFQEAKQLVEDHWPEIQRLARCLIHCGTVEYPTYGGNPLMPRSTT